MQTRQYQELFNLTSSLIGAGTLAADEQLQLSRFLNRRFFEAYQTSPIWPRYVVVGEKRDILSIVATNSGTSSVNQNYKILGDNSNSSGLVYQGITTSSVLIFNTGSAWTINTAATATEQADGTFTITSAGVERHLEQDTVKKGDVLDVEVFSNNAVLDGKNLIPYVQTNKETIGDVIRVHRQEPFLNRSALEYDYFMDVDGVNLLNVRSSKDNEAFVTYKKKFTAFAVTSSFDSDSSDVVPEEFFNFLSHAAYADFLRIQNKQQEAITEETIAKGFLDQELEKADMAMSNITILRRINTHVSRQSR